MKKKITTSLVALTLASSVIMAQTGKKALPSNLPLVNNTEVQKFPNRGCASVAPDLQWETALQELITARQLAESKGQNVQANYTIPVVIHIIHGGQAIGTYPNVSNAQAASQIGVLNADFAGTGFNSNLYPATAFQAYAAAAGLPAANKDASNRVKISNFNINFCLAAINPAGGNMAVAGLDRIDFNTFTISPSYSSKNPAAAAYNSPNTFQSFIDNVVKPQTIWDPVKYMNIWITDTDANLGLLGYATFPVAVPLAGITGNGSATTDGLWCYSRAFGNTGTLIAGYNRGRTACHETGHWLGLRHIGGDASGGCATDFCNDTPKNKGGTNVSGTGNDFGQNYGAPTYPFRVNTCTGGLDANVNGDMFMNFMDYSDDPATYMFTEDQRTRAQTVMANGTYRKFLGTHGLCSVGSPTPASSGFTSPNNGCNGVAVNVTNNSSGNPTPTYTWSASPSTGVTFNPNANATNPTITFATIGTYTIGLAAQSGTTGISNTSNTISIASCTTAPSGCNDTLTNFFNTDTITIYRTGTGTGCAINGYVGGNNCYADKEKAEWYSSAGLVGNAKVTGAIVLFYRNGNAGTRGTGNVTFKMYNGNNTTGATGAAVNSFVAPLTSIVAGTQTTNVTYCGNPLLGFASPIILPYSFDFAAPTTINNDFLMSVVIPTTVGDTIVVMQNSGKTHSVSTAWELQSSNTWFKFNDGTANTWQQNASLCILPKITCGSVGITDVNGISNNYAVFPNPSEGKFNFAVTLPVARDLQFNVVNNIGQTVFVQTEKAITSAVIGLDLSHLAKGIYFVNIIDSKGDKAVRKLVIQ